MNDQPLDYVTPEERLSQRRERNPFDSPEDERDAGDFLFGVLWGLALASLFWFGVAAAIGWLW